MDDCSYHNILAWLARLAPDTTLRWGDDSMGIDRPYSRSFADVVMVPDQMPAGFNWVWTIIGPDHPGAYSPADLTLVVDYDLDLYELRDPDSNTEKGWVVPRGGRVPAETRAALDVGRALNGGACAVYGAWAHATLSLAVEHWIAEHTGRSDHGLEPSGTWINGKPTVNRRTRAF